MNEDIKLSAEIGEEVEIKTVDTLISRGVRVEIPAPQLLKWFGKKTISIVVRRPTGMQLLEISKLYLQMKQRATTVEPETMAEAHNLVVECLIPASRIIAYGAGYSGWMNRIIARHIRKHMDMRHIAELWTMITSLSGVHDFSNIIRSMQGMRMTMPRI